ncbi:hypothetical protein BJP36_42150 [Moorena producens JHB]|uniref:Uncharacterized protein n=1 Tax=Moorena producens (strain JHB) TaxID=1454205 RepID=A0A9Q9SSR3_MOOP1|nr:hypothetical protein [Moorena producens]WAN68963.1 hypothetical protein BJP36_42150 [Moorena producens JHB]
MYSGSDSNEVNKIFSRFPIPDSRFPIPDSRFPIPDSRFPIPDSRLPIPDSRFPIPSIENCCSIVLFLISTSNVRVLLLSPLFTKSYWSFDKAIELIGKK